VLLSAFLLANVAFAFNVLKSIFGAPSPGTKPEKAMLVVIISASVVPSYCLFFAATPVSVKSFAVIFAGRFVG